MPIDKRRGLRRDPAGILDNWEMGAQQRDGRIGVVDGDHPAEAAVARAAATGLQGVDKRANGHGRGDNHIAGPLPDARGGVKHGHGSSCPPACGVMA
jgi:hypothetical protein